MTEPQIEFDALSPESQDRLINSSLNLMRDLTEIHGSERGMALWDKISEVLGNDLKGKLFFGMISGHYSFNGVMFTKTNTNSPVPAIKAIRTATGAGLKEAKDIYDYVRDVGPKRIECKGESRLRLLQELRESGNTAH